MAKSMFDGSGDGPTSTPDWTRSGAPTTPRVATRVAAQASGYPADDAPAKVETEDRSKRSESDGGPTIWKSYEAGY